MDKLLLVEDNQSLIDIYSITFRHENFEVEVARDGEECLQKVKINIPDIILLDVMMPKMNGLQTLEKLKADEVTKNIPVIMLSNIAESKEEAQALQMGAIQYIVKSRYLPMEILGFAREALLKSRMHN